MISFEKGANIELKGKCRRENIREVHLAVCSAYDQKNHHAFAKELQNLIFKVGAILAEVSIPRKYGISAFKDSLPFICKSLIFRDDIYEILEPINVYANVTKHTVSSLKKYDIESVRYAYNSMIKCLVKRYKFGSLLTLLVPSPDYAASSKNNQASHQFNSAEEERRNHLVEAMKKAEEEKLKREAEEKKKTEEERLKREDEEIKKAKEERLKREAEEMKKAEEERLQREDEEKKAAEEAKLKRDAEQKQLAEEEALKREDEEKKKAEEAKLKREAEEERLKREAEEKKKAKEAKLKRKAEQKKLAEEAEKKRRAERRRKREERKRLEEEEKKKRQESLAREPFATSDYDYAFDEVVSLRVDSLPGKGLYYKGLFRIPTLNFEIQLSLDPIKKIASAVAFIRTEKGESFKFSLKHDSAEKSVTSIDLPGIYDKLRFDVKVRVVYKLSLFDKKAIEVKVGKPYRSHHYSY